jgi:hypothetical protein
VKWPPRSPDLKIMDFHFGGVVRNQMFTCKPKTIERLKTYIDDVFDNIDKDCGFRAYVILSINRPVWKNILVWKVAILNSLSSKRF